MDEPRQRVEENAWSQNGSDCDVEGAHGRRPPDRAELLLSHPTAATTTRRIISFQVGVSVSTTPGTKDQIPIAVVVETTTRKIGLLGAGSQ